MLEEWDRDGRGAAISVENLRAFDNNISILSTHNDEAAEEMEKPPLSDRL